MNPRLSIIVPSRGLPERPGLTRCVASILHEMRAGDELLVSVDHSWPFGYRARDETMHRATGDALLFMDDDDVYTTGAFAIIRQKFEANPEALHIFRMDAARHEGVGSPYVWHTPNRIAIGNLASQVLCVPRGLWLGAWGGRYEGDFDFVASLVERNPGVGIEWHQDVICVVRPECRS